jgi:hypothetical protein
VQDVQLSGHLIVAPVVGSTVDEATAVSGLRAAAGVVVVLFEVVFVVVVGKGSQLVRVPGVVMVITYFKSLGDF